MTIFTVIKDAINSEIHETIQIFCAAGLIVVTKRIHHHVKVKRHHKRRMHKATATPKGE